MKRALLYLLLLVLIFVVYARVISFPFIQDDYTYLNSFKEGGVSTWLKPAGYFYRPLAAVYLYGMYRVFGENPIPFHVAALLIHFFTTVIIIRFVRAINGYEPLAWCVGFIYAFAGAVHIECLIWAVGIHDLGGMFFFMLAMLLFVRSRHGLGAIAYLAACLFKEQAIVLPLILLFWKWDRAWPYLATMAVVVLVKLLGASPFALPPDHPYHISLWGWHIPANIYHYIRYMAGAFGPLSIGLIVIMLSPSRGGQALWAWLVIGVLPAIFLPNHLYRYYAIYSLPVLILLVTSAWVEWLEWLKFTSSRPLVVLTAVIVITSIWNIQLVLHGAPMDGGTNNLVQKIERCR